MNVLGFDTSATGTSACALRTDGTAVEIPPGRTGLGGRPRHAQELLPAIERSRVDAGLEWEDVDAIAVGLGPGGFTGLRIGIATARALAHARAIPLRPVVSLAALAAGLGAALALPVTDARRGQVYAALYEGGHAHWPPFVATPEDLLDRVRTLGTPPVAAGDGSLRCRDLLEGAGVRVAPEHSELHVVRALHLCKLAHAVQPTLPEAVVPLYLRAPDAKPAR